MTSIALPSKKPWYKEPWPWILMSGPFLVVIASLVTAWIAVKTSDGLVTEDYYRKGLSAQQTIARSEHAKKSGLSAGVMVSGNVLTVRLAANDGFVMPALVHAQVSHPTRAGLDQVAMLVAKPAATNAKETSTNGRIYSGEVRLPTSGHWLIVLEDEQKTWRLVGNVILPTAREAILGADADNEGAPVDFRQSVKN